MEQLIKPNKTTGLTFNTILNVCSDYFMILAKYIIAQTNDERSIAAWKAFCYLTYHYTTASFEKIAQFLNIGEAEEVKQAIIEVKQENQFKGHLQPLIAACLKCGSVAEPEILKARESEGRLLIALIKGTDTPKEATITINQIIALCADYFQVSTDQITGKCRKQKYVQARQAAMYLCKQFTKSSLQDIGLAIGSRDHTTVIHGLYCVKNSFDAKDDYFKPHIEALEEQIKRHIRINSPKPKHNHVVCPIEATARPLTRSINSIINNNLKTYSHV